MKLILRLLINTTSILLAAYLLPGVSVNNYVTALVAALVLGILDTFVKPVLTILTLPITILTLGLFYIFLNILMVFIATAIIPGFSVDNGLSALLFIIILSISNWFLYSLMN